MARIYLNDGRMIVGTVDRIEYEPGEGHWEDPDAVPPMMVLHADPTVPLPYNAVPGQMWNVPINPPLPSGRAAALGLMNGVISEDEALRIVEKTRTNMPHYTMAADGSLTQHTPTGRMQVTPVPLQQQPNWPARKPDPNAPTLYERLTGHKPDATAAARLKKDQETIKAVMAQAPANIAPISVGSMVRITQGNSWDAPDKWLGEEGVVSDTDLTSPEPFRVKILKGSRVGRNIWVAAVEHV